MLLYKGLLILNSRLRKICICNRLAVSEIRHNNARLIHHSDLLALILCHKHNHAWKDTHCRKENRHKECGQKKGFLLDSRQIFTRDDYIDISKFHSLFPLCYKFDEYIVHSWNEFLERIDSNSLPHDFCKYIVCACTMCNLKNRCVTA